MKISALLALLDILPSVNLNEEGTKVLILHLGGESTGWHE